MTATTADRHAELAALVETHQAGVWRYLRFLGCDRAEAEDLVQETFLTVFRQGFQTRSAAETASYLRCVARNQLLMARRKQQKAPPSVDLVLAESVWAEAAEGDGLSDYLVALEECLAKAVTPRVREALQMHYAQQATREAIAARLSLAAEGLKTLLRRARAVLRDCVERRRRP